MSIVSTLVKFGLLAKYPIHLALALALTPGALSVVLSLFESLLAQRNRVPSSLHDCVEISLEPGEARLAFTAGGQWF